MTINPKITQLNTAEGKLADLLKQKGVIEQEFLDSPQSSKHDDHVEAYYKLNQKLYDKTKPNFSPINNSYPPTLRDSTLTLNNNNSSSTIDSYKSAKSSLSVITEAFEDAIDK
jgi:hypothetical protein